MIHSLPSAVLKTRRRIGTYAIGVRPISDLVVLHSHYSSADVHLAKATFPELALDIVFW
jgi:hypothetical protein